MLFGCRDKVSLLLREHLRYEQVVGVDRRDRSIELVGIVEGHLVEIFSLPTVVSPIRHSNVISNREN